MVKLLIDLLIFLNIRNEAPIYVFLRCSSKLYVPDRSHTMGLFNAVAFLLTFKDKFAYLKVIEILSEIERIIYVYVFVYAWQLAN